jgi:DNA adenine methylase
MAALLKSMKGKAVVSVNDIPEMRQAFAGLKQRPLSITYSVGSTEQRSPSRELLITNF